MSFATLLLVCAAGLYVGWNIGANDAANCVGTTVGAGLMRYWTAMIMVAVCAVAGALLQGHHVMHTVGKGIVTEQLSTSGVLAALLCGGLCVSVATFKRIPVSTSQAVVGGVAGVGLAADLNVDFSRVITIVECWIICPILSAVMAWGVYVLTRKLIARIKNTVAAKRVLRWLVVVSACYASYSLGANNLGNAVGPIATLDAVDLTLLSVLGSLSIAVGALTFGKGVTETVAKSITRFDVTGAFAAQVAAAFGLHLFSMLGVPVSTSQAIVGGVLGVGLVHGIRAVSKRKIAEIAVGWVVTPIGAAIVAFLAYLVVR